MNYILNLLFGGKKKEKKQSIVKDFMANPDDFTYSMKVVNGNEIVITIKRTEEEADE